MQEARVDTVVQDGEVVTSSQVYQASIAIKDEKIVALGPKEFLPPAERYIDASGKYVLPGAIDAHVHLGEVDDYSSGSKAAAYAGLTTMIPFTVCGGAKGETVPQTIDRIREEGESQSVVDFAFSSILTNEPYLLQGIPQAFEMGVTSFKMYMTYKKRGNRMCPDDFICKAMEIIAAHGGFTQLHCENGDIIDFLEDKFIAEGRVKPVDYPSSAPGWVEEEAINRAIKMGALTHCPTYVVHLSTQLGLERIKQAQAQGQKVWCETCPQYMLLSDAEMERWGPHAKIGPPLRPRDGPDRDSLWRGSEEGYISIVASDHAPRDRASREGGWNNVFVDSEGKSILFGSPGLETLVPLAYSEGVVRRGLPLTWMARVLAENPARVFGLYPQKGVISVGADADLLIIDPDKEVTISAADHHSNVGYTLFEGWKVKGWPWMTLLRGRTLLNQGVLEQKPGYGQYLHRQGPLPPLGGPVK